MDVIDVDEPTTWTTELLAVVESVALAQEGHPITSSDVWLQPREESSIQAALAQVLVRAFHASRLLPHEIERIRREGLAHASEQLFVSKVEEASARGALTAMEAAELILSMMPLDGSAGVRAAQTCVAAGTNNFRSDSRSVRPLLESWGGEVLYFAHENDSLGSRLREIGRPAIVEVAVPACRDGDRWFPSLESCLVGAVLGFQDVGADGFLRAAQVLPGDLLGIHVPGGPWWQQFPQLPR